MPLNGQFTRLYRVELIRYDKLSAGVAFYFRVALLFLVHAVSEVKRQVFFSRSGL